MKINIKNVATTVASVAVVGITIKHTVTALRSREVEPTESETIDPLKLHFLASDHAIDTVSERMMSGYYDDKSNAEAAHDHDVLYQNFVRNYNQ